MAGSSQWQKAECISWLTRFRCYWINVVSLVCGFLGKYFLNESLSSASSLIRYPRQYIPAAQFHAKNSIHNRFTSYGRLMVPFIRVSDCHHHMYACLRTTHPTRTRIHTGLLVRHRSSSLLYNMFHDSHGQHVGLLHGPLSGKLCAKRESKNPYPADDGVLHLAWGRSCGICKTRTKCRE